MNKRLNIPRSSMFFNTAGILLFMAFIFILLFKFLFFKDYGIDTELTIVITVILLGFILLAAVHLTSKTTAVPLIITAVTLLPLVLLIFNWYQIWEEYKKLYLNLMFTQTFFTIIPSLFVIAYWINYFSKVSIKTDLALNQKLNTQRGKHYLDSTFLGVNRTGQAITLLNEMLGLHTAIFGTTGSGKTTTLMSFVKNALDYNKGLIIINGKGDNGLVDKVKKLAKGYKRTVRVFSGTNEIKIDTFTEGTQTQLTDKFMSLFDWSEPFYRTQCKNFIQLLFKYCIIIDKKLELIDILKMCDIVTFRKSVLNNIGHHPDAEEKLRDIILSLDGIDEQSICKLRGDVSTLYHSDLGESITSKAGAIKIKEALTNRDILIFSINGFKYMEFAKFFGKLIISEIRFLVSQIVDCNIKDNFMFIGDEAGVWADESIIDLLSMGRSQGLEVVLGTQSYEDYKVINESLAKRILENVNTLIVQKQNEGSNTEDLCSYFGTVERPKTTVQTEYSMMLGRKMTSMGSVRMVNEYRVHPDQIKELKKGQGYIAIKETAFSGDFIKINNLE